MISIGALVLYGLAALATFMAWRRSDGSLRRGLRRSVEQMLIIIPRMIFALIAAGFIVKLIPTEIIVGNLGADAGLRAILIGSAAGLIVPAGPVVAFALAASFALAGASIPALVAFLTGWSVFAAHRVLIFEVPMLGLHWLRLRMLSVVPLPVIAGLLASVAIRLV